MPVTHTKVSLRADDADTTLVRPTDWNANHAATVDDGLVGAPGLPFASEATSGWYRIGAGILGWAILGVERLRLSASELLVSCGLNVTGTSKFADGASGTPSQTYASDTDLGRWRIGANVEGQYGSLVTRGPLPSVSVRACLATGDGITDDSSPLNSAVDVAGAGGTVVVEAGTYMCSGEAATRLILDAANQTWILMAGATIKMLANASAGAALVDVKVPGVTIRGPGVLDGNKANQTNDGHVGILCTTLAANPSTSQRGLLVDGVEVANFKSGAVGGSGKCIEASMDRSVIQNCYVHDSDGVGIKIGERSTATTIKACVVTHNRIENMGDVGWKTVRNDATNLHWGHEFSFNTMVNCSTAGRTTFSAETADGYYHKIDGNYAEKQTLSLVGLHHSVIRGNIQNNSAAGSGGTGMEFQGDNCVIDGNIIDQRGAASGRGIWMTTADSDDNIISNNQIRGASTAGIQVGSGNRLKIIGNHIRDGATNGLIHFANAATKMVGVEIVGNYFYNTDTAIALAQVTTSATNVLISGNTFHSLAVAAVRYVDSATTKVSIVGNQMVGTTATLYTLLGTTTPTDFVVRDNTPDNGGYDQVFSRRLLSAIGLYAANLTDVTAFASNVSYWVYIGKAPAAITTCDVVTNVVTAAVAAITWAEVAIAKGTPVANGNVALSRLGFTSVAATFNSTGIKKTTVALSGVAAGDDLWVGFGSQAATMFQTRGLLADDIQSGVFQTSTRPSTMAIPTTATIAGATIVPSWCQVKV